MGAGGLAAAGVPLVAMEVRLLLLALLAGEGVGAQKADRCAEPSAGVCLADGVVDDDCCIAAGSAFACAEGFAALPIGMAQCTAGAGGPTVAAAAAAASPPPLIAEIVDPEIKCCTGREPLFYGIGALIWFVLICAPQCSDLSDGELGMGASVVSLAMFIIWGSFWIGCVASDETQEKPFAVTTCILALCGLFALCGDEESDKASNSFRCGAVFAVMLLAFASVHINIVHMNDSTFLANSDAPCCGNCPLELPVLSQPPDILNSTGRRFLRADDAEVKCCTGREPAFYGVGALVLLVLGCCAGFYGGAEDKESALLGGAAAVAFGAISGCFWIACLVQDESQEAPFATTMCILAILVCFMSICSVGESDSSPVAAICFGLILLVFASVHINIVHTNDSTFLANSDAPCCGNCGDDGLIDPLAAGGNSSNTTAATVPAPAAPVFIGTPGQLSVPGTSPAGQQCCAQLCCVALSEAEMAMADMIAQKPDGDDSCIDDDYINNGACDACGWGCECTFGTDHTDCSSAALVHADSCRFAHDGECDEDFYCPKGTDLTDCSATDCQYSTRGCRDAFVQTVTNGSVHVYMLADKDYLTEVTQMCCDGSEPRTYAVIVIVCTVLGVCAAGAAFVALIDESNEVATGVTVIATLLVAIDVLFVSFWVSCEITEASVEDDLGNIVRGLGVGLLVLAFCGCCTQTKEGVMFGVAALLIGTLCAWWGNKVGNIWTNTLSDCPVLAFETRPVVSECLFELDGICDAGSLCPAGTDRVDCSSTTVDIENPKICIDDPSFLDRDGRSCSAWPRAKNVGSGTSIEQVEASCDEYGWSKVGWVQNDVARLMAACPASCDTDGCTWCGESCLEFSLVLVSILLAAIAAAAILGKYSDEIMQMGKGLVAEEMDRAAQQAADEANLHKQAGLQAWETRALVSHLTADELANELNRIDRVLSKEFQLVYHFTDQESAQWILRGCPVGKEPTGEGPALGGTGIRASTVGQLGGGVSFCLTSPVEMGWEPDLGGEFRRNLGDQLWGQKYYEVMAGEAPPDVAKTVKDGWGKHAHKLDVLLVLQMPKIILKFDFKVPGRDDVFILPKQYLTPDDSNGSHFYSNTNVVKLFGLDKKHCGDGWLNAGKTSRLTGNFHADGAVMRPGAGGRAQAGMVESAFETWLDKGAPAYDDPKITQTDVPVVWNFHENVARFKENEMKKALIGIDQKVLTPYRLVYYFCSREEATAARKNGLVAKRHGDSGMGVRVVLTSPVDLGWKQYCVDDSRSAFVKALKALEVDQFDVMLILKVPSVLVNEGQSTLLIPEASLWRTEDEKEAEEKEESRPELEPEPGTYLTGWLVAYSKLDLAAIKSMNATRSMLLPTQTVSLQPEPDSLHFSWTHIEKSYGLCKDPEPEPKPEPEPGPKSEPGAVGTEAEAEAELDEEQPDEGEPPARP